jgi:hypothetical protein
LHLCSYDIQFDSSQGGCFYLLAPRLFVNLAELEIGKDISLLLKELGILSKKKKVALTLKKFINQKQEIDLELKRQIKFT